MSVCGGGVVCVVAAFLCDGGGLDGGRALWRAVLVCVLLLDGQEELELGRQLLLTHTTQQGRKDKPLSDPPEPDS